MQPNPPARILDAVASGAVDIAVVWEPLFGWYARHAPLPLTLTLLRPAKPGIPLAFDIAMGVRKGARTLAAELDAALVRNRPAIEAVLDEYGIPRAGGAP
jgi:hypothetical protein